MAGILRYSPGQTHLQRVGFLDQTPTAMLSVEAVGPCGLPRAAQARCQPRPCMEHVQICPWPMAIEPESGAGLRSACPLFCKPAIAQTVYETDLINRTAVVRDPYARWCGRREVVRPLPIPIMCIVFINNLDHQSITFKLEKHKRF